MKVFGSRISYYTGKLEAYLRYKGLAYTALPTPYDKAEMLKEKVGAVQMPIVDDNGVWMSDTTPIMEHLETVHMRNPVIPDDPVIAFLAFLIEDYGDEWLWRSAMYYRWWYRDDRELASSTLTDELTGHVRAPRWMRKRMIIKRQVKHYVERDGITDTTRPHVEKTYANALAAMSEILANRPFLLGSAPSVADFGMMGPMFRHFGQDPTPQEIMRSTAPLVYDWVARMWLAKEQGAPVFVSKVGDETNALLREVCECHLGQLAANAEAYTAGQARFNMIIQWTPYRDIATSHYRAWCLEELRRRFANLGSDAQAKVKTLLPFENANILWDTEPLAVSGYNTDGHLPFGAAINVFEGGLP